MQLYAAEVLDITDYRPSRQDAVWGISEGTAVRTHLSSQMLIIPALERILLKFTF